MHEDIQTLKAQTQAQWNMTIISIKERGVNVVTFDTMEKLFDQSELKLWRGVQDPQ